MSYPEHDKLEKVKELSQAQGEFIEWLREEKGIVLTQRTEGAYWAVTTPLTQLLAEFHGIDLNELEREKRAMLKALQNG